ncbi:general amidase [Diplodia corticola]|uniref:General amidase n=1 Tax=Diplodia corticola TaxID=236234 RepID=A0A1J9RRH8_9PEZI|nr:general amidase [Diplodia corticola]OJD30133.1 general amidase [Diplodia corticola]
MPTNTRFIYIVFITVFLFCGLWTAFQIEDPSAQFAMDHAQNPAWQDIASNKRRAILDKIPREWILSQSDLDEGRERCTLTDGFLERLLDPETRHITGLDSSQILESVRNRTFTAVQVVRSFCKRSAFAHQLNNNLLEIMFSSALKKADDLDRYLEEHGEVIGPLHGLPVSMKDQFHVKDAETSMAYVGWIGTFEGHTDTGKEGKVESELVRELVELGAVPIVKTSLVQTLWYAETNNNIIGYTWNPVKQTLSCGGSSGGQGALLALRGTTIGFGTDIGGSVSIPAAFNGIYSIKPSHGRISYKDTANSSPGQAIIPSVVGIMGDSISSLRLTFRSLLATSPWLHDPEVLRMPWAAEDETFAKISFGFFENDGVVAPHPPIARALRMVKEAIENSGHKTVPWSPPAHNESAAIHSSFMDADGGADVFEQLKLSGEPLIPELQPEFGDEPAPPTPLLEFYNNTLRLKKYRERYQSYWESTSPDTDTGRPVDAVILPAAPHAAVIPGKWIHYDYATIANTLDYAAIIIPVTNADKDLDKFDKNYSPMTEKDRENWQAYDPDLYHGAPASIQILGRRHEEQKLLSVAQAVVDALKKHKQQGH